jgi:glycogen debranching enzyme
MVPVWTFEGRPPGIGSAVTLVEGACFCICAPNGDIDVGAAQGLFFRDTRFLSGWRLQVNGTILEPLGVEGSEPFSATFVTRVPPKDGQADSTLIAIRRRFVGNGMREDLSLQNLANEPSACTVVLEVDADLAHLFEVKEGRPSARPRPDASADDEGLHYASQWLDHSRGVDVRSSEPAASTPGRLLMQVVVPARGDWSCSFEVELSADGLRTIPQFSSSAPLQYSKPAARLRSWRRRSPMVTTPHDGLSMTVATAIEDLGSLRIFDPEAPERVIVAAGSPWFMTLFGRDSLLTSWMTLLLDPSLATGTLSALAQLQGEKENPLTEEQPGRIMHEVRWGAPLFEGLGDVYYGTVDATPLFVMLLAELARWGFADDILAELLPHADRALRWIADYGDADGDGFVEYKRTTDRGLLNQGWKDSFDGVNFASGHSAEPPIAPCEVQGYAYAAYVGRAELARAAGDTATAEHFEGKATQLKQAFNEAFWLPERGWFATGLDAQKRPIDSLTSNMGHCLWTGIVDAERAAEVAKQLTSPSMFTGWGIRTLAATMGAFNPVSYHNGSVWPHDSAIAVAGLVRYGFTDEGGRLAMGLIDAAESFAGRLPELMCGFSRSEFSSPVAYPSSCSPQAWASASVFLLLRALLRLEPALADGVVSIAPCLPEELGELRIENVRLGDARVTIEASGDAVAITDLPRSVQLKLTAAGG